jgi:hypothetical protein
MTRAHAIVLLSLCSCAIDDRSLNVRGACVGSPEGGLISDFSAARPGYCPPGICSADLVGSVTLSLGVADVLGLVFPYRSGAPDAIVLTLASTTSTTSTGDAAPGQALRAELVSGPPRSDASIALDGFALQFLECVDTSAYSGVRFTTEGNLGPCPLRFAVQFEEGDAGTFSTPCPIDQCFANESVLVTAGTTTLMFPADAGAGRDQRGGAALAGMQWELSVPAGGCTADFTIDEIRLVSTR